MIGEREKVRGFKRKGLVGAWTSAKYYSQLPFVDIFESENLLQIKFGLE